MTTTAFPLSVKSSATAHSARDMRCAFQKWLRSLHAPVEVVEDLGLVVYEALANAAEHAYHPDEHHRPLHLHARVERNAVVVTIADQGHWLPEHDPGDRGRGLQLMRFMAELQVDISARGTTVVLRAPLHRGSRPT